MNLCIISCWPMQRLKAALMCLNKYSYLESALTTWSSNRFSHGPLTSHAIDLRASFEYWLRIQYQPLEQASKSNLKPLGYPCDFYTSASLGFIRGLSFKEPRAHQLLGWTGWLAILKALLSLPPQPGAQACIPLADFCLDVSGLKEVSMVAWQMLYQLSYDPIPFCCF